MVADSKGTRRYSPTVMTGEGKEQTQKAMRLMLEREAPMLVTNPGTATLLLLHWMLTNLRPYIVFGLLLCKMGYYASLLYFTVWYPRLLW